MCRGGQDGLRAFVLAVCVETLPPPHIDSPLACVCVWMVFSVSVAVDVLAAANTHTSTHARIMNTSIMHTHRAMSADEDIFLRSVFIAHAVRATVS